MLAVAMLIEDSFSRYAFTGGDIDRAQAETARSLIEETLGIEVALPLGVDAERLFARIGRYVKGKEAIERYDRLFQGDELALFRLAPRRDLEAWFMDALRQYHSPSQLGVTGLALRWLDADRDLETLCRLACLDEAGPRFDPVAFATTLAATWVTVPKAARAALAPFECPVGAPDTVYTQLGMALLDMTGLQARRIRRFIPRDEVLAVLAGLFPERAGPIREVLEARVAQIVQGLETVRGPVEGLARRSRDEPESGDGRSFLRFRSVETLSEAQRIQLRYLACTARAFAAAVLAASRDPAVCVEIAELKSAREG